MPRILSTIKLWVVPQGEKVITVKAGILKGVLMRLDLVSHTQVVLGLYERELFGWFRRFTKGAQTALDIGSGMGMYTLYFLKNTPIKKVVAFEPHPEKRAELKDHLKLNGFDKSERVQIVTKYVNSYLDKNEITLDSISSQFKGPIIAKMDVDTLEVKILEGAKEFLKRPDVRWIIETHSKELERDCLSIFKAAGYRTKIVRNAWWRIFVPELRPIDHNRWMVAYR